MADTELVDMTEATSLTDDDLLYGVDDPAGTPADRKVPVALVQAKTVLSIRATSDQTVANSTFTDVEFDTEDVDTLGAFDSGTSATDVTLPDTHTWLCIFHAGWDNNDTNSRILRMDIASGTGWTWQTSALSIRNRMPADAQTDTRVAGMLLPGSGDVTLRCAAWQDSGGSLNLRSSNAAFAPTLVVIRLA